MKLEKIFKEQAEICTQYSTELVKVGLEDIVGLSLNTNGILMPINGLRHPEKKGYSGWYIWSGEEFSESPDFFKPIHVKHLITKCPQVLKFLALPPGYRFLVDNNGYTDVWFDEKLLEIDN